MMARPLKYYMPVCGLGLTQIMGYGTLLYSYAVLLPIMADELGLGLSDVFGLLSIGFFFGGLSAILAGFAVDRIGGRWVMTLGSVASAGGLWGLSQVTGPIGLTVAILLTQMAAMFVLYDVAFASIAKLRPGPAAQSAISGITLFGGVASTIYWPLTLTLSNLYGWQVTWQIHAASVLLICVPAHWFSLRTENGICAPPEKRKEGSETWPPLQGPARRQAMIWMVLSFTFSGYIMGALMSLWVSNVEALGHSAAVAVSAGALIGPAKTAGRFFELIFGRALHPLITSFISLGLMMIGFSILLGFGATFAGLMVFAVLYGMGDGIKTITMGTLPLALFGPEGFGARLGWIAFIRMSVNSSSPFLFAWITEAYGGWTSFSAMALFILMGLGALFFVKRHSQ